MIIIKSQDGDKIIKVESVVIDSQVNRSIGALTSSSVYYILGSYESKERVKEVMEEIEGHIKEQYVLANIQFRVTDFIDHKSKVDAYKEFRKGAIYTMPKE